MPCFLTVGHVQKVDLSKTRQAVACHHDTMSHDTMTAALPRPECCCRQEQGRTFAAVPLVRRSELLAAGNAIWVECEVMNRLCGLPHTLLYRSERMR